VLRLAGHLGRHVRPATTAPLHFCPTGMSSANDSLNTAATIAPVSGDTLPPVNMVGQNSPAARDAASECRPTLPERMGSPSELPGDSEAMVDDAARVPPPVMASNNLEDMRGLELVDDDPEEGEETLVAAHAYSDDEAAKAAKRAALRIKQRQKAKAKEKAKAAVGVAPNDVLPAKYRWLKASSARFRSAPQANLWLKHREVSWDSTARKYTPMALRGLKCTTFEPWADDGQMFESEFDRVGEGSSSHILSDGLLHEALHYSAALTCRRRLKQASNDALWC